jgi:hypothetical protein
MNPEIARQSTTVTRESCMIVVKLGTELELKRQEREGKCQCEHSKSRNRARAQTGMKVEIDSGRSRPAFILQ